MSIFGIVSFVIFCLLTHTTPRISISSSDIFCPQDINHFLSLSPSPVSLHTFAHRSSDHLPGALVQGGLVFSFWSMGWKPPGPDVDLLVPLCHSPGQDYASASPDHSSAQLHSIRHQEAPCCCGVVAPLLSQGWSCRDPPASVFSLELLIVALQMVCFHAMCSSSLFLPFLISLVIGSLTLSVHISESVILICTFLICVFLMLFLYLLF